MTSLRSFGNKADLGVFEREKPTWRVDREEEIFFAKKKAYLYSDLDKKKKKKVVEKRKTRR